MNNWRPEEWEEIKIDYGNRVLASGQDSNFYFMEAGADALLEALFKLAKESPTGKFEIDSEVYNVYSNRKLS